MVNSLGVAYDVGSIMHYPSWAFQAAPGLHTIVRKDGTIIRGNRQRLSKLDIQQASQLYCGLATTPPPTTSQPGNYGNKRLCGLVNRDVWMKV